MPSVDLAGDCATGAHAGAREQSLLPRACRTRWPRNWSQRSGFARAFFCNSGTEANEAAIKLARKRAFRKGETDRVDDPCVQRTRFTAARSVRSPRLPTPSIKKASDRCRAALRLREFNDVVCARQGLRRYGRGASSSSRCRERAACIPASVRVSRDGASLVRQARRALDLRRNSMRHGTLGPLFAFSAFGVGPTS